MDRTYLPYVLPTLICLSALLCGLSIDPYHSWGGDFALYIQQAEALLSGRTQELLKANTYAMDHSELVLGPHLYPPGFPILLLPILIFWGKNLWVLKMLVVACFLLFQGVLFLYFRHNHSQYSSLLLLSCFSLNPWLIRYCNFIISDIPFLLFTTLSLWHMRKFWEGDTSHKTLLLLGLSMGVACLIRSVGIVLLATYLLVLLSSRYPILFSSKRKTLPRYLGLPAMGVCLLLIGLGETLYPSGANSYLAYLDRVSVSQMGGNMGYYLRLPYLHLGKASIPIYVIGVPSFLLGMSGHYRQYLPEFLFCILYLALLVLWPFTDGVRFIFPLLPFVVHFTFLGVKLGLSKTGIIETLAEHKSILFGGGIGTLLLVCTVFAWKGSHSETEGKVGNQASLEVFDFVRREVRMEERLSFFRPRILRLFTGREGLALANLSHADQHGIRYHLVKLSEETQSLAEFDQRIFVNKEFEIWMKRP